MKELSIIFIFSFLFSVYVFVSDSYKAKVEGASLTIYPFWCDNLARDISTLDDCKNAKKVPDGRTSYKIDITKGEVISWFPDSKDVPVKYFTNKTCTIINSDNWDCASEYNYHYGVIKGKYFNLALSPYIYLGSVYDWGK